MSFYFHLLLKVLGRRRVQSVSGSQTSLLSTSGTSAASNDCTRSNEWPDPPEMPVCSTEDEATSIHSDSGKINFK